MACKGIQSKRKRWKPSKVVVLFVGESPPANGTFFYCGNSNLARYTREALERVCGKFDSMSDFLRVFKEKGCYLVDLCDDPINNLDKYERNKRRNQGVKNLSRIIEELEPKKIVVVMKGIKPYVKKALGEKAALFNIDKYTLPFPSHGHQKRYMASLVSLVKECKKDEVLDDC